MNLPNIDCETRHEDGSSCDCAYSRLRKLIDERIAAAKLATDEAHGFTARVEPGPRAPRHRSECLASTANPCDEDGILWETRYEREKALAKDALAVCSTWRERAAAGDKRIAELEAQLTLAKVPPQIRADIEALGSIVDLRRQVEVLRERLAAAEWQYEKVQKGEARAWSTCDVLKEKLAASERAQATATERARLADGRVIASERLRADAERAVATARADALADALMHVREPGPTRESIQWLLDAARAKAGPTPEAEPRLVVTGHNEFRHVAPESPDAAVLRSELYRLAIAWLALPRQSCDALVTEIRRLRAIRDAAKEEASK